MRTAYLERRDALAEALRSELSEACTFELPRGGISLWLKATEPRTFSAWLERAAALGAVIAPGSRYRFDGRPLAATRLVFSRHSPAELHRAVGVLRRAWLQTH